MWGIGELSKGAKCLQELIVGQRDLPSVHTERDAEDFAVAAPSRRGKAVHLAAGCLPSRGIRSRDGDCGVPRSPSILLLERPSEHTS